MKQLTSNQIRQMWLDFFMTKGHHFVEPVSLIPVNDPSLLWINSGVATLKPYFDGRKTPPSKRLTNSQKAIRTNDIENVGVTARHQTMFEMLGNFSIGDYFKKGAIQFAWELLTSKEWFNIPVEKLYITVFDEDTETYELWTKEIGIPTNHIFKMGRETNFWDVGQGPCGPNTEIFFDRGEVWDPKHLATKLLSDDLENDRYIEIWNIVFSQFNNDGTNHYTELPRKNIDTGAGLERLTSIFQNTPTNFETDLFLPTIKKVEQLSDGFSYSLDNYFHPQDAQTRTNTAFKVIADHVRAVSFAIADGVFPSNKDRGYVLRRLIRRSSVYGGYLGIHEPFLYQLVDEVVKAMQVFYPYLVEKKALIKKTIYEEEVKFLKTLSKGFEMLENLITTKHEVSGQDALLLFESFGFPIELTIEIAANKQVKVDVEAFNELLAEVKENSRSARKNLQAWNNQNELFTKLTVESEFIGYETLENKQAKVVYLFVDNQEVQSTKDEEVYLILDKTPFYAEKGGQAADAGYLYLKNGSKVFVDDVQQGPLGQNIHHVQLNNHELKVGDVVEARVDEEKRLLTMKNHSGTHLVHAALRQVLGNTVMQSGSYNDEHGLRMDFTYNEKITSNQLAKTETIVNQVIDLNIPREVYYTSLEEAIKKYHALAFFTEKYDEIVRIVKFGDFSCELCGGTHVESTREIENFMITKLESKGSGVYRIHCLTSNATISEYVQTLFNNYQEEVDKLMSTYHEFKEQVTSASLETKYEAVKHVVVDKQNINQLKELVDDFKQSYKEWDKQKQDVLTQLKIKPYLEVKPQVNAQGVAEIRLETKNLSMSDLKTLADVFRNKYDDLIVILFSQSNNDNFVVVAVSESLQDQYKAIEIFKNLAVHPKGGGNANLAQGKY